MVDVLRGRVITPEEEISDGVVVFDAGRVSWVGTADLVPARLRAEVPEAESTPAVILPGLVDVHNHGGGGASFPDAADAQEAQRAVWEHRRYGTTRMLASLVTAAEDVLLERATMLRGLVDSGLIEGVHAEGPFLSAARCGAQNPAHLIDGDPRLVTALATALGAGLVSMTVAPDVPGSDAVVAELVGAGVLPSFGHTDAAVEVMDEALDGALDLLWAGGRRPTITHLFNGMRGLHHREPGPIPPVLAAARRGRAVVELVADGVHLHPHLVRDMFATLGAGNIALVTDAMAAAGMADGAYRLGSLDVEVADGVARLAEGGSIAGGTAHLLDVVRITHGGGVPLVDAVRAASLTPAEVIAPSCAGVPFGALRTGYRADAVVVDASWQVQQVWRDGELQ